MIAAAMEFHWSMLVAAAGVLGLMVGVLFALRQLLVAPPANETPSQKRNRRSIFLVLLPVSLLGIGVGVVMYVFVRPVEQSSAERDQTIRSYLDAVRQNDAPKLRALTASGYQPDSAFLRDHVQKSERYEQGTSYITNGDDLSCVRGMLFPDRTKLIVKLVKERERWRVLRAAETDPCEAELRF